MTIFYPLQRIKKSSHHQNEHFKRKSEKVFGLWPFFIEQREHFSWKSEEYSVCLNVFYIDIKFSPCLISCAIGDLGVLLCFQVTAVTSRYWITIYTAP